MARTAIQVIFDSLAEFPVVGSTTLIYVDNTTQKAYLWDGAAYVEITGGGGGASIDDGTGVITGFNITINADTTKIDIASGIGQIVDNTTTPGTPIITPITYAGQTGIVVTNIATANVSYISINAAGTIVQRTSPLTPAQRRDEITIGVAVHSNRIAVNAINNLPEVAISDINQLYDLFDALRNFNESGNVFSANGANLQINKSVGQIFKRGVNFQNDPKDPNTIDTVALTAPANIRYRLQDGTEYANTNAIDPGFYDLAGVKTAVPAGNWTIQRIYLFPSNLVRIQYGQATYSNSAAAEQNITKEIFVTEQNIQQNGLLRGLLIVQGSATVLNSTGSAVFFEVDRFGSVQSTSTGGGTTTMQQSYNNSISPQITTTTALGAVQFKRGSAADTDAVFQILNGSSVANFSIDGNGAITQSAATSTMFAQTMSNSYAAGGIGHSITIGNTQTNALTGLKIDLGTAAVAHTGILINAANSSATKRGINIAMEGGTGAAFEWTQTTTATKKLLIGNMSALPIELSNVDTNWVGSTLFGTTYVPAIAMATYGTGSIAGQGMLLSSGSTAGANLKPALAIVGAGNTTQSGVEFSFYTPLNGTLSAGAYFRKKATSSNWGTQARASVLTIEDSMSSGSGAANFTNDVLFVRATDAQTLAGTFTYAGSVVKIEHVTNAAAGTLTGTRDLLNLTQSATNEISKLITGVVGSTERFKVHPMVTDGASAIAYLFDTTTTLTTTAKIASFANAGVEKVYIDNAGNILTV